MSLFLKDPKTCMNPWHALSVLASVCALVLLSLLVGKHRFEAKLRGQGIEGRQVLSPTGMTKGRINPADGRFSF